MERTQEIIAECCSCGYTVLEGEDHQATNVFCPRCGRPDLMPVKQLTLRLWEKHGRHR